MSDDRDRNWVRLALGAMYHQTVFTNACLDEAARLVELGLWEQRQPTIPRRQMAYVTFWLAADVVDPESRTVTDALHLLLSMARFDWGKPVTWRGFHEQ